MLVGQKTPSATEDPLQQSTESCLKSPFKMGAEAVSPPFAQSPPHGNSNGSIVQPRHAKGATPTQRPDLPKRGNSTPSKLTSPLDSISLSDDAQPSRSKSGVPIKTESPDPLVKIESPHEPCVSGSKSPVKSECASVSMSPIEPHTASKNIRSNISTPGSNTTPDSPATNGSKFLSKSSKSSPTDVKREVPLYGDLPDMAKEATSTFEVIKKCIYSSKAIGNSDQDTELMQCECKDDFVSGENIACGEHSDCINRLTLMECVSEDCGCQIGCKNQRFQNREYAPVSVFKTEKKGYGLRADEDLKAGQFIYEYVGEVIDENKFRQRNTKYPQMGIKHFYFMSLDKDQFIDATMKGSISRFVNHSCAPNCEAQKWVVGEKFRMGIFALRDIRAGEELAFDYNVDRYGAEKQPCYCGEPVCQGYIGGKTQTDSSPKLSENLKDALGIDASFISKIKKARKKRADDDDEDYMEAAGPKKPLDLESVPKVMSTLRNTKERWIVCQLLSRIRDCDDENVLSLVTQIHGYTILGKFLTVYKDDENIITMILDSFINFPKITKNKITAAGIEPIVETLTSQENEIISNKAKELLQMWSVLETSYRIPRRADGSRNEPIDRNAWLDRSRDSRSTSRTKSPERSPKDSTEPIPPWLQKQKQASFLKQPPRGPRADRDRFGGQYTPRPNSFHQRPFDGTNSATKINRGPSDLPWGWHKATHLNETYYYSNEGRVSWETPTQSCSIREPLKSIPPPPPKAGPVHELRKLIQEVTAAANAERLKKEEEAKEKERQERKAKRKEKESGKVYDIEKTRKYLSVAFGKHVPNMVNKYKADLGSTPESAREHVKKYAKEIVELLVDKEMRYHKQVIDPLNICTDSKVAKIKLFVDEYVQKLIARRKASKAKAKSSSDSKRKHEGDQKDGDTKRVKSPSLPLSSGETTTTTPTLTAVPPMKKRTFEDDSNNPGSPKRRRSFDGSPRPNGASLTV